MYVVGYRVVDNFRGVLIFIIFVTDYENLHQLIKVVRQSHREWVMIERMALYQASPSC